MLISNSKSPSLPFRIPLYVYRGIFYSPVNFQGNKIFPIPPDIYWPKGKWKQLINTILCRKRVWLSENWPSKQKLGRFISIYTGESVIPLYVYRGLIYTGESYCPICTLCCGGDNHDILLEIWFDFVPSISPWSSPFEMKGCWWEGAALNVLRGTLGGCTNTWVEIQIRFWPTIMSERGPSPCAFTAWPQKEWGWWRRRRRRRRAPEQQSHTL